MSFEFSIQGFVLLLTSRKTRYDLIEIRPRVYITPKEPQLLQIKTGLSERETKSYDFLRV
ncbi:hypothetical protein DRZ78_01620 [Candidatus Aerophobetes bacterium]|uniref:Uncharacterized protein n=1 Tax=Aerophobetes bacterium TaxID=2030807 RepID=A0A662D261_UNCAE|nr:MAG: hypothetical protein DRZ78_01620 [Candidatus Aerophobetes bacterium]